VTERADGEGLGSALSKANEKARQTLLDCVLDPRRGICTPASPTVAARNQGKEEV
jgi:hypothetical protein